LPLAAGTVTVTITRSALALVAALLSSGSLFAAVSLLPDDKVDTAPEVSAINQNFQTLDSTKVDKKANYVLYPSGSFKYRRPVLEWVSVTTVDVENNTETANETAVVFRDGEIRRVTENTGSTSKHRRFIITENAVFASGTENSGLRPTYVEANNTWYAIYAVKSQVDSTKFVLVGDTVTPVATNFAALDTAYGTNGWTYLGYIRNGDQGSTPGDILAFDMSGDQIRFRNAMTGGNSGTGLPGIRLATTASGTSITWTSATGTSGAVVPPTAIVGTFVTGRANPGSNRGFQVDDGSLQAYISFASNENIHVQVTAPTSKNLRAITSTAAVGMDTALVGFWDAALSGQF
jgi:hypothetical protein